MLFIIKNVEINTNIEILIDIDEPYSTSAVE